MRRRSPWFVLARVSVRNITAEAVPGNVIEGLSVRLASRAELLQAAEEKPDALSTDFVNAALDRGDICVAAFDGEHLVGFIWGSFSTAPHSDGLWVKAEHPYRYGDKSFVEPQYRGQRLVFALQRARDMVCLERGYPLNVGFIETHNYPSLLATIRSGSKRVGYAGYVRLFGRSYPFRTPGVVPHTFQFYRREVPPS
ncbi:MAG: hypothetical protein FJ194_01565 [Gammaproteobacteria bacterium]|nr:hypothetical protein [Gammaproteobacteria bacterium]